MNIPTSYLKMLSGAPLTGRDPMVRLLLVMVLILLPRLGHAISALDGFDPNANATVRSTTMQPDGKIIIGGDFTIVGGASHNYLARLNHDSTPDSSFIDPNVNNSVWSSTVQPDGKIVIAGNFTSVNGTARGYIARLNSNGTLDSSFSDPAANAGVNAIALQPDGKIIVAGNFTSIGGATRGSIARLNSDGTLDNTFADPAANAGAAAIALQWDGRVIIAGNFTTIGGTGCNYIARLNSDGTLDASFIDPAADAAIAAIALQADGKVVIAGSFANVSAAPHSYIARLNSDGTLDTAFTDPGASGGTGAAVIALQADGKVVVGGSFVSFSGPTTRNFIARLNSDGTLDTGFDPNANNTVRTVAIQADAKIVIGGDFISLQPNGAATSSLRNYAARLESSGNLDANFDPNANDIVYTTVVQPDGKIVIAGQFTSIGGVGRNYIARLNPDGSLDATFDPKANDNVYSIAIQPDGKIIIAGDFTSLQPNGAGASTTRNRIARLNSDGTLDTTFNPNANNIVWSTALQADGRIVIAGWFTSVGGTARTYIARLNADGSLDTAFNPAVNNRIFHATLQPDAKIVIGGYFTTVGGSTRNRIARLNSNGTLDTSFIGNANDLVYAIAVQADGKIVIGGWFTAIGSFTRNRIARLNSDGNLDTTFNPNANSDVQAIAVQTDGKIVISGNFTTVGGVIRTYIARLNPNGTLDTGFNPAANLFVSSIALAADGKIIIGGPFSTIGGITRNHVARLSNSGPALQTLTAAAAGTGLTWARSSTAPEVERVTFERSSDLTTWTLLGNGARLTGGWSLAGLSLPAGQNIYLRARGIAKGEFLNGSASLLESVKLVYLPPAAPLALAGTLVSGTGFTANWSPSVSATGYLLDVATNSGFTTPVPGYSNLDVANVTSYGVTGLSPGTTYYYRVRAYNGGGASASSSYITVITVLNGACGASDGSTFTFAPATGLCSVGTASSVTGVSPWNWSCNGLYGGTNATCSGTTALPVFTIPALSKTLTVPVTALAPATAEPVSGYLIKESATPPSASQTGWSTYAPRSYIFTSTGTKTLYAWLKNSSGKVSASASDQVIVDTTPPVVRTFTATTLNNSLTVPVTAFSATDNVAVAGYLITETATVPSLTNPNWSNSIPMSYTAASTGNKTLYAWAMDTAGNISLARTATTTIDMTPPMVTAFVVPALSKSLTVSVSSFTATDNVAVNAYQITESSLAPAPSDANWSSRAPTSYTASTDGPMTLYAWARDTAGNVSAARRATLTIDVTPPTVTGFTIPPLSKSLTVAITSFTATDDNALAGYLVTESASRPAATLATWSTNAPRSYTFATAGNKTLNAWAKDKAGNVSDALSAPITVDTTAPVVRSFTIPATNSGLTVPVIAFSATDNVAVDSYLITATATAPSPANPDWSGSAPASYTVASTGSKTLYAWAMDTAGNISAARSATVNVRP